MFTHVNIILGTFLRTMGLVIDLDFIFSHTPNNLFHLYETSTAINGLSSKIVSKLTIIVSELLSA